MKIEIGRQYKKIDGKEVQNFPEIGDVVTIRDLCGGLIYIKEFPGTYSDDYFSRNFEPLEDRTTWHPHHDVIVAWAKGAKVRGRREGVGPWINLGSDFDMSWLKGWEYEVIPEPDHTAEIADIERKMRELSDSQKELADRLEKIKRE